MTYPAMDQEGDIWYDDDPLLFTFGGPERVIYIKHRMAVSLAPVTLRLVHLGTTAYGIQIWHEDT